MPFVPHTQVGCSYNCTVYSVKHRRFALLFIGRTLFILFVLLFSIVTDWMHWSSGLSYPFIILTAPLIVPIYSTNTPFTLKYPSPYRLFDYHRLDALEFRMIHEQFPEGTIRVPGCVPVLNRADVYTADDDKVRGRI